MINDNTYLIPYRKEVPFIDDLSYLLGININNDKTKLVGFTCALAYMCQYITAEELAVYVSPEFGKDGMRRRFSRLVKAGILRADKFKTYDGHSRMGYCLTKKGIAAVSQYFPRETTSEIKVRRSGGYVPEHDYSCGMNILSALYLRIPFFWEKEYVLPGKYKVLRAVRSDCVLVTRFKDPQVLFIEQDMGTENSVTLVNKVGAYGDHGVQQELNCSVIFSCRKLPTQDFSDTLFQIKWINSLRDILGSLSINGNDGIYKLYELLSDELAAAGTNSYKGNGAYSNYNRTSGSKDTRNTIATDTILSCMKDTITFRGAQNNYSALTNFLIDLKRLLVLTGVCSIDELSSFSYKKEVADIELLPRISSATTLSRKGKDFTISDLTTYADQLDSFNNTYRIKYQNVQQANNSFSTLISMLSVYKNNINASLDRDEVLTILSGLPVYVVPTSLFARKMPYILPVYFSLPSRQKNLIYEYYGVPAIYCSKIGIGNHSTTDIDKVEVYLRDCFIVYDKYDNNTGELYDSNIESVGTEANNEKNRKISYLSNRSVSLLNRLNNTSFRKKTGSLKLYENDLYMISYADTYEICSDPYINAVGSRVCDFDYDSCIINDSEFGSSLNNGTDSVNGHSLGAPYTKGLICYTSACSLTSLVDAYYISNYVDMSELDFSYIHFIFECENKAQMKKLAVLLGFDNDYDDYLEKKGFKVSFSLPGERELYRVYGYGDGVETSDDIIFPISPISKKEVEEKKILKNLAELM